MDAFDARGPDRTFRSQRDRGPVSLSDYTGFFEVVVGVTAGSCKVVRGLIGNVKTNHDDTLIIRLIVMNEF